MASSFTRQRWIQPELLRTLHLSKRKLATQFPPSVFVPWLSSVWRALMHRPSVALCTALEHDRAGYSSKALQADPGSSPMSTCRHLRAQPRVIGSSRVWQCFAKGRDTARTGCGWLPKHCCSGLHRHQVLIGEYGMTLVPTCKALGCVCDMLA
jgi:hypothetical protein